MLGDSLKMNRKLIALDIDGTILDKNLQVLPSTRMAIESLRAQGHYVTLATGRSRVLAKPVIDALDFENYILCNGAAAFIDNKQTHKQLLPIDSIENLKEEVVPLGIDIALVGLDETRRITSLDLSKMTDAMESFGSTLPKLDPEFVKEDVYAGLVFYSAKHEGCFDDTYQDLRFVRWHPECVDVLTHGISKATTILKVANDLDIQQEDIICFGDGMNDREMLSMAGVGVAMGNANVEVQKYADLVTRDHNSDGIYHALNKLGLITV